MYHSIYFYKENDTSFFNGKNTWDDFKLIPSERPIFSLPEPNLNYIDIPGYGRLDTTDTLTGYTTFKNREGSFEFILAHKDIFEDGYDNHDPAAIYEKINEVLTFMQGSRLMAVLEDDPDWYYVGRFYASEIDQEEGWSLIEINYDVEPYKMRKTSENIAINLSSTAKTKNFLGVDLGEKPISPEFTLPANSTLKIVFTNNELNIVSEEINVSSANAVRNLRFPQIVMTGFDKTNQNKMILSGSGSVTITYRVGGF